MATLFADRFLVHQAAAPAPDFQLNAIDLATGDRVRLRISAAGAGLEQQAWTDACARAYADGRLVDFGLIGPSCRFEATTRVRAVEPRGAGDEGLLEWLEHARPSSPRVIAVARLPAARDLRLRGFVPCDVGLLRHAALSSDIRTVLAKRSIVLLDASGPGPGLALALLRLWQLNARDACAIVQRRDAARARIVSAAERRAVYDARPMLHARVAQLVAEAGSMRRRGRHAAAERALRAAIGASGRRGDWVRAGDSALALGRLVLERGRAADAKTAAEQAHNYFQQGGAAAGAIDATIQIGLAQTDLAALRDAEQTCRAAYSAAIALRRSDLVLSAAIALARTLFWQERYADAQSILEAVTPGAEAGDITRYWCLASRLHVAAGALCAARGAVAHARRGANAGTPAHEALIRLSEAAIQSHLGDVDAVQVHVAAGLAAARSGRLPLAAIKLRLVHVEALCRADRANAARQAAQHLGGIRPGAIPPLLRSRVDAALGMLERPPAARETAPRFQIADVSGGIGELDGLRNLVAVSHQPEDEGQALSRVADAVRRHTHAAGVGVFGAQNGRSHFLGGAGACSEAIARRAIDIAQPIVPARSGSWIDAAVPIAYCGRVVGAMAMRWNMEGPENPDRVLAFSAAAAAVCAPLTYVLLERQSAPPADDMAFDLVGASTVMADVRKAIARAANAPFTVLLEGESGSGKELVARAIHRAGCRRERRFCALNCAAMPEDLVDAELFGHAKGAFTGAAAERLGLFESADGGTVFLDEVGELSARAQAKVLRVLQEGEVRRLGEAFTRPFDARLVAATNRSLRAEVDAGRFRQDLLYRLDVIRINVPPLRDRVEDIPLLAARFWKQAAERIGSKAVLGQAVVSALARYDWPGNVRELQNVLTALVVAAPARGVVGASQLPLAIARAAEATAHESLESARLKFEQRFVRAALARTAGHRGRTAAALGLSRQGFAKLMQRLHLDA